MKRIVKTKNSLTPDPGHKPVGVSVTVPRLSLPISELIKRFTLTTLKEMEAKSLLNYDFGPDCTANPFDLLDRLDLRVASCIDLTDIDALKEEVYRQIDFFKRESEARAKGSKPENERPGEAGTSFEGGAAAGADSVNVAPQISSANGVTVR